MKSNILNNLCTIITAIIAVFCIHSCAVTKPVTVQEQTIYTYKDSTILHRDTISVEIPVEKYINVVKDTTSILSTQIATSTARVDTNGFLYHTLENRAENALKKEIVYQDKIIYRDSTIVKEIPVEVEKIVNKLPQIFWYSIAFNLLILIILIKKLFF